MAELFRRLGARPGLTAELVVATVFVTLLALATPLFVIQVLNRYLAHGVDATLATLTAGAVLAVILEYGFREVRLRLAAALSAGPDAALSNWAFATLTRMRSQALSGLSARRRQDLMQGPDLVQTAYAPSNLTVLLDLPFALLFVGALYLLSPVLAGIALVFIAANLIMALVGLRLLKAPTKALSAANAGQAVMGGTAIHGGDTIRAFNAGPFLRRAWRQHRLRTDGLRRRVTANNGRLQSLAGASGNLMTIATIAVGAMLVVSGHLTVGAMIGANILSRRALVPFSGLARMAMPLARAREVLSSLEPLTRVALEPAGGTTLPAYGGGLELRDLAFAWRGARTPLFEGLSLTLAPGESLVVTGGNGSGKTTLARLLVGLMEPSRGQVLADGVDLRQLAPA
ncbi:MAG: ATP-binding cassette domain-containing protein, partial [Rhodobacterales bacterium]|nr:ATP-binding cassette domain-containing protein [Rhodobacterales bacterium]